MEITDDEFDKMVQFAKDEPDSRFSLFMQRTAGYKFFGEHPVAVPKYILYQRYKGSSQLELLEKGEHPEYRRVYKIGFDKVQQELWATNQDEE